MYYFILGCVNLDEFGLVNYTLSEKEIVSTTQRILDYKFKRDRKIIYEGADIYKPLEHEVWKQRCQKLLQTFFSRAGKFSGIITFPDTRVTAKGKPWENVINTLRYWCENSNSDNAKNNKSDTTGLIFRNYNLENHLSFCGMTDDEIKATSTVKSFQKKFKALENSQRFLVFNPSEKVILIIRMTGSKYKTLKHEELKSEVYHCADEIIHLSFLLKNELKNSGVIVTGLVAYSGENTHSQISCKDCDNFIVSSEIFNSGYDFDTFWKRFVRQDIFERLALSLEERREKSNKATLFETVSSKMVGYLAHLQFTISKDPIKPVLPVTEKEPVRNIKQAELLLDQYQMEIAYSDERRIFLTGNYGTGKTVVALKKLDLLYEGLKEEDVIYYVNFAGKSQLHLEVMEKNKRKEKVKVIRGGTSLSNIVNSKILPDEEKNKTKNIHLIVDEYDSQDLSEEESESLYQIFEKEQQFKYSTVLIAVQPMKIARSDSFYVAGKKREFTQEKHMLGKLKGVMKVFKLRHVMRVTVEINSLIEITQNYLNNKTSQYKVERKNYSGKREKNTLKLLFPTLRQESSEISNKIEKKPEPSHQNDSTKSKSSSLKVVSEFSSTSSIDTVPIHFQEIIDHDELFKLTSTSIKKNKKSLQKVVTKYNYTCDSEIGHGINGPLPKLIKLSKSSDECEQIGLIAFLLLEILKIKSKRIAIIHFDKTDPPWLQLLFKVISFFTRVTVTNDVGEFLRNSGSMVLINNYNCVKGLEFSEVLLTLDEDEYYLKHFIPEAIARCMNNLTILVRPKQKGNRKSDTVLDLVHHWQESNDKNIFESKEPILTILKLKFCSDHNSTKDQSSNKTHCQKDTSKIRSYKIHKRCEWYKDVSVKIQQFQKIDRNLHLEAKKIPDEAEAM